MHIVKVVVLLNGVFLFIKLRQLESHFLGGNRFTSLQKPVTYNYGWLNVAKFNEIILCVQRNNYFDSTNY